MPNDDIVIDGKLVSVEDLAGVRIPRQKDAASTTAAVLVAAVSTSSASAAIAANTSTRRQLSIQNTGTSTVEISPTVSFAMGAGWQLTAGAAIVINYNGAIYARVAAGTGEIRAWSEA